MGSTVPCMGINIFIWNRSGEDHPAWDGAKHSGDGLAADAIVRLAAREGCSSDDWLDGTLRPADFTEWRSALAFTDKPDFPNPGRFGHMLDLLEADDQWWISIIW